MDSLSNNQYRNDINMLQLMKEAGCIGLVIGLESFIQENLNGVNKGFNNVKEYKRLVSTIQILWNICPINSYDRYGN